MKKVKPIVHVILNYSPYYKTNILYTQQSPKHNTVVVFNLMLVQITTPCDKVQDYLKPEWLVAYSLCVVTLNKSYDKLVLNLKGEIHKILRQTINISQKGKSINKASNCHDKQEKLWQYKL